MGLHFTGSLLEWMERAHPEYFDLLRALVQSGQVEIVGGGFYEPILIAIPPEDRHEQITRLADYIEKHFGARPRGAWLAERVWEPQIPSSLAPSGVEYTLVDDNHFLGAGFELEQLYGYYLAEDQRHTVKVVARPESTAIPDSLSRRRGDDRISASLPPSEHPGGFAAMGDDLRKIRRLARHLRALLHRWLAGEIFSSRSSRKSDWLETATPGDASPRARPWGAPICPPRPTPK